jgi:nucleoside-diphosphate-sugar epimerase
MDAVNGRLNDLPDRIDDVAALEELISRPTPAVVEAVRQLDGDLMILGVGGKMGPTLAMLARRAVEAGGLDKRVIGVSRFSQPGTAEKLQRAGIETIACDLMAEDGLDALPDVSNIVYMIGHKFGATGQERRTWAINAFLPGRVAHRFRRSRFVVFSSGNVYPFTSVVHGHCTEDTPPKPVGEYAQSVLGRERIFGHYAAQFGIASVLFRLNYAVELRYGVLLDLARKVWVGDPIDLNMGHANVIWQGDANAYALRALALAECPPLVLNVTGPELLSVRMLATWFGERLGRTPNLVGTEQPKALLSNAQRAFARLGYPSVPLGRVVEWVAQWVIDGGETLDKPTHFEVRNGRF